MRNPGNNFIVGSTGYLLYCFLQWAAVFVTVLSSSPLPVLIRISFHCLSYYQSEFTAHGKGISWILLWRYDSITDLTALQHDVLQSPPRWAYCLLFNLLTHRIFWTTVRVCRFASSCAFNWLICSSLNVKEKVPHCWYKTRSRIIWMTGSIFNFLVSMPKLLIWVS
jgi:hypothetical protein